ncbi:MAG: hypothetical protein JST54_07505 [Deltaproteobacteria bacterium]|nr:hypothetical protein [Deltaproteobacteria bacterium]
MPRDETSVELSVRQWRGALPDEQEQALLERIAELELGRQMRLLRVLLPVLEQLLKDEQAEGARSLDASGAVH